MSWGIQLTGTKEKVREESAAELDKIAAGYAAREDAQNQAEAADIRAAKASVLSALDHLKFDDYAGHVKVSANGSRSTYSVSVNIAVERVKLHV